MFNKKGKSKGGDALNKSRSSASEVVLDPLSEKEIAEELEKQLSLHSSKASTDKLNEPLIQPETDDLMP